jgi:Domain of unknown function (DUF6265)
MKKKDFLFLAVTVSLLSMGIVQDPLQRLRILEGTWVMNTKRGVIGEHWKAHATGLKGRGFMVHANDTTILEEVTIVSRNSDIFYESRVEGQNNGRAVPFKLTSSVKDKFVFENKAHDYPTTIIYSFVANDSGGAN